MTLIERVAATQKTIDTFLNVEFEWGTADCAQLAARHVEALGIPSRLSEAPNYKTERGARRALTVLDVKSMEGLVESHGFASIAPASALVGDIVGFPGGTNEKPWTALGIYCGGDRILGFADVDGSGARAEYGPLSVCTFAWRVI
jgi:hypothetical protein